MAIKYSAKKKMQQREAKESRADEAKESAAYQRKEARMGVEAHCPQCGEKMKDGHCSMCGK